MAERITVQEAAKMLGVSEFTVRCRMKDGTLPIGKILNEKGARKNYLIYRNLVNRIMGTEEGSENIGGSN